MQIARQQYNIGPYFKAWCSFHCTCSNTASVNDYTYFDFQKISKDCRKFYKISCHYSKTITRETATISM